MPDTSYFFGWQFNAIETPQGEILAYETPGGARGSVRSVMANEIPKSLNYILVQDLDAAEKKVKDLGGEIVLPKVDVPQMGSFFWFKVPGGPILACWADAPSSRSNTQELAQK